MKTQRVLVATVLAAAVAACQPSVETPMPTAAPSSAAPTTVLPSPTPTPDPTPTPTYPPGTEQAVSALVNYLKVWDQWAQKPTRGDRDGVARLAADEALVKVQLVMIDRLEAGVSVIGRPTYRDWQVGAPQRTSDSRPEVVITLCQDFSALQRKEKDGQIRDLDGTALEKYTMRRSQNGKWLLGEWTNKVQPC